MIIVPPKYNRRNNIQMLDSLDEEFAIWPEGIPLQLKRYPVLKNVVNTGEQYYPCHRMWRDYLLFNPTPSVLPPLGSVSTNEVAVGYLTPDNTTTMFTHSALVNGGTLFGSAIGLGSSDRVCIVSPLHTSEGLQAVIAAVAHAAVAVIPSLVFDPEQVIASLERDSCTVLQISPQQLQAVLDSPSLAKHNPTTLEQVVIVGSAHQAVSNFAQLIERATSALKAKKVVVAHTVNNVAGALLTDGRLLPHVEAKIVAGDNKAVQAGTTGKLLLRGFNVAHSSWGGAKVTDKNGWLDTGLQAATSPDGSLTIKH